MSAISSVTPTILPPSSPPPENNQAEPTDTQASDDTNDTTPSSQTNSGSNSGTTSETNQTSTTTQPQETKPATDPNAAPIITAKSQIAANAEVQNPVNDADAQPARVEQDDAQALLAAREQAENYRLATVREQYLSGVTNLNETSKNGEKLDLRIPLIDELPDRPMPGIVTPKT